MLSNQDLQDLQTATRLLVELIERHNVQGENAAERRALFRLIPNEKPPDAGTSDGNELQGSVEFTQKEIATMPQHFRKLLILQKKRCHVRKHVSGENSTTYEIRYRADGYNLSACGKTLDVAKQKFLEKLKTAKPLDKRKTDELTFPDTFKEFAIYYCEKFRKRKISPETYYKDQNRFNLYLFPAFGSIPIDRITPSHCQDLLDRVLAEGKGKTAEELRSIMSVIFKGAIAHGLMQRNPIDLIFYEKHVNVHGHALTKEEERAFLDAFSPTPLYISYMIALFTGLRPNELKTVQRSGPFLIARNSKRKSKQVEYKRIYICKRLADVLDGLDELPNLTDTHLSKEFPRFCPNHRLYDLRVTFNTRCKELGVSDHARMHFMGHSLGKLGEAYTDFSDEYLLKEGQKLDEW